MGTRTLRVHPLVPWFCLKCLENIKTWTTSSDLLPDFWWLSCTASLEFFVGGLAERFNNSTYQVPQWSAVANQNPSCCNPTEYWLVICLGCSLFIFSKRKSRLEKAAVKLPTNHDEIWWPLLIAWRIEHLKVGRWGTWTNLQHWIPVLMCLHLGHVKKCLQSHRDLSAVG